MTPPTLTEIDALAIEHRRRILARLIGARGDVLPVVRRINPEGARRRAIVRMQPTGAWTGLSGGMTTKGSGFVALVQWLADVDETDAAELVGRLVAFILAPPPVQNVAADVGELARVLHSRRRQLNLTVEDVAARAGLAPRRVEAIEERGPRFRDGSLPAILRALRLEMHVEPAEAAA